MQESTPTNGGGVTVLAGRGGVGGGWPAAGGLSGIAPPVRFLVERGHRGAGIQLCPAMAGSLIFLAGGGGEESLLYCSPPPLPLVQCCTYLVFSRILPPRARGCAGPCGGPTTASVAGSWGLNTQRRGRGRAVPRAVRLLLLLLRGQGRGGGGGVGAPAGAGAGAAAGDQGARGAPAASGSGSGAAG